ncbi:MAG: 2-amino-4-hydroxy-6-hydroxymethyldihydropteridine diphosphokinase [Halioglobus sp.]|nr:2-amino-4-hydroxy-6-hydroxymethyldihydropteridine diphosphokinase [Halioglobus sp.]
MTPAYVALGSNLGEPAAQLCRAVSALAALPDCTLDKLSSVYSSAALGPGTQPDYLNAVVRLQTQLTPLELLDALQRIEQGQGRVRDTRWGPRTLDLDLLLYGRRTIDTQRLAIPHPRMQQRHFVLYPLCEISGKDLEFPNGATLETYLRQCPAEGLVKTQHQLRADTPTHSKSH